jgi:CRISPR-associated protein Cas1
MEIGTLYVTAQGSRLTRVGERLVVRSKENKVIEDVPFFRLRQIICFGSIELTNAATVKLLRQHIDVVFLSLTGRFKCRLDCQNFNSVKCRQQQYKLSLCTDFRLKLASQILKGKLQNARNWLVKRNRPARKEITQSIWKIATAIEMIDSAQTTDELLGIEGIAAKDYFSGFRLVLKQEIGFNERNRRPPKDPVNAMLSFGYMLLFNMVLAAIQQVGLDPAFSNLHAIQDRRPSLALDLMEEFRCLVVDTVVVRLVNLVRVQPRDFFPDQRNGVKMREEAIALLVRELQNRLRSKLPDPVSKKLYPTKDLIIKQAYQYKSIVLEEKEIYEAVAAK